MLRTSCQSGHGVSGYVRIDRDRLRNACARAGVRIAVSLQPQASAADVESSTNAAKTRRHIYRHTSAFKMENNRNHQQSH